MEAVLSPKHQEISTRLHGATSQETVFFVLTCVRNSNSTEFEHCLEGHIEVSTTTQLYRSGSRDMSLSDEKEVKLWILEFVVKWRNACEKKK
jgi:hypothetical protein